MKLDKESIVELRRLLRQIREFSGSSREFVASLGEIPKQAIYSAETSMNFAPSIPIINLYLRLLGTSVEELISDKLKELEFKETDIENNEEIKFDTDLLYFAEISDFIGNVLVISWFKIINISPCGNYLYLDVLEYRDKEPKWFRVSQLKIIHKCYPYEFNSWKE